MHKPTRTSALIPLCIAATALAQEPAAVQEPVDADTPKVDFSEVDVNRDGSINKQEALQTADLQASFDLLDANRDEALSPSEFARWSRAGKVAPKIPEDPSTAPGGSAGAQHMPDRD